MTKKIPKQVFLLINQAVADNAEKFLWQLPVDGSYEVEFRPRKNARKLSQNAALWGVAYPPIMEFMGLQGEKDREELHEYFCGEYWGWKAYTFLGQAKQRPIRTTTKNELGEKDTIDKSVMYAFYQFIQTRGAEHGVFVPDPDPMYGLTDR